VSAAAAHAPRPIVRLTHGRVELALHELRGASEPAATALLLLHGLGERSPRALPAACAAWPGGVFALDFTGHGASTLPQGGGYTAEQLMGDADAALRQLGRATLLGRGLGAYVALLLAGARPEDVRGAILCDGPGLSGGGARPGTPSLPWVDPGAVAPPDPFALVELAKDVRPPEYAAAFARQAVALSGLSRPLSICAKERATWLRAVAEEPGTLDTTLEEALAFHARQR
jgi:pimeloyl-ACP methyl ester carboxylesterase